MEKIALHVTKAVIFILSFYGSSRIALAFIKKKKDTVKLWDPEIIFPSVIIAAVVTKISTLIIRYLIPL